MKKKPVFDRFVQNDLFEDGVLILVIWRYFDIGSIGGETRKCRFQSGSKMGSF